MKILFISMRSIHAIRWIENLKESGHELYWFDILNRGEIPNFDAVHQIVQWNIRKFPYLKGEYFIRKKMPHLYNSIQSFLEVTVVEQLTHLIEEIKPDLVHSFEMQSCSYPILNTMQKYPQIKWLYSCWGNDLFYYQNQSQHVSKIKAVLSRIQYLHTDCNRDFLIAQSLGFKGKHLGVIPGGGGYNLEHFSTYIQPVSNRKIILVKGYQHKFGRGLVVVKALQNIKEAIQELGFEVVVFGAHKVVLDWVQDNRLPFTVYPKDTITHQEILKIMGRSAMYIGNSVSDGMPNTLLEAMFMGAFPIQSNPGGATAEIIVNEENGYLIEEPEFIEKLKDIILKGVLDSKLRQNAFYKNLKIAKEYLNYKINQQKIVDLYLEIKTI